MAIPVLEGTLATNGGAASTTINVNRVTGIVVGELLLLIVANDWSGTDAQFSNNVTGWEFIGTSGDNVADAHIGTWWRIADGTEPSTVTVTALNANELTGHYTRISGAHATTPINVSNFTQGGVATTHTIPAVTTTAIECLAIAGLAGDGGDTFPFSEGGTGWTLQDEVQNGTGGASVASCFSSKGVAAIGSTGNSAITPAVAEGAAYFQIAIAPSVSTGNTITGDVTVTPSINSTMDYTQNASIAGDVSVTPSINSSMAYVSGNSIVGDVTVDQAINATMDYTQNASIVGDVTITPDITSVLVFNNHESILGDITITPSINSTMTYTSGDSITGDVTVSVAINAVMDYILHAAITGDVSITPVISSTMNYTQYTAPGSNVEIEAIDLNTTRNDPSAPISVTVDSSGGVAGLTVTLELRDTIDNTLYLDFDDNAFKTSGWVQKSITLSDLTGGFYASQINLGAIINLPTSGHLIAEYGVSGSITGIISSVISFTQADLITTNSGTTFPLVFNL